MELREALVQISEIRAQMARGQVFRGYRSVTTAVSGAIALIAAALQPVLVPEPASHVKAYVIHWSAAAALSLAVVAVEMIVRARRSQSHVQSQLTLLAVEQFMPSVVAGALVTYVVPTYCPAAALLLPGLWIILFSLGVFASSRLLPRASFYVAGGYLLAGLLALVLATRGWAYWPWLMGLAFGTGQLVMAGVLYCRLEKPTGQGLTSGGGR